MAGDTISPSIESNTYKGAQMIEAWNAAGLDYATLGNHEFDFGPDVLLRRMGESHFKWLAANVLDKQTGKLFADTPEFIVREFDGVKIGIFGILLPETLQTSRPGPNIDILDPCATAARVIPKIRAAGAQVIVALTHLSMAEDKQLARCSGGEFNLSKMGTGEGAQAYGTGVYKAENKKIGETYRDQLSQGVKYQGKRAPFSRDDPAAHAAHQVAEFMETMKLTPEDAIQKVHEEYADAAASSAAWNMTGVSQNTLEANRRRSMFHSQVSRAALKLKPGDFTADQGHLYESELHIDPDHLLHWDRTIGEHSPYVRQRIGDLVPASDADRVDRMTGAADTRLSTQQHTRNTQARRRKARYQGFMAARTTTGCWHPRHSLR